MVCFLQPRPRKGAERALASGSLCPFFPCLLLHLPFLSLVLSLPLFLRALSLDTSFSVSVLPGLPLEFLSFSEPSPLTVLFHVSFPPSRWTRSGRKNWVRWSRLEAGLQWARVAPQGRAGRGLGGREGPGHQTVSLLSSWSSGTGKHVGSPLCPGCRSLGQKGKGAWLSVGLESPFPRGVHVWLVPLPAVPSPGCPQVP